MILSYFKISRSERGIYALDGLRAIAVLLVLFRHATRVFSDETNIIPMGSYDWATFFVNGWVGVDLFFVLSGFLRISSE